MTGAITWEALAYLAGTGGAIAGVWFFLYRQIESVRTDLADYKLKAAEKFATTSAIEQVEERVVAAINRLGDRLDKLFQNARNQA